jgi:hypothetical protein
LRVTNSPSITIQYQYRPFASTEIKTLLRNGFISIATNSNYLKLWECIMDINRLLNPAGHSYQPPPQLSHHQANNLYQQCRNSNHSHDQAVAYVKQNGAHESWLPPLNIGNQQQQIPTQPNPIYANPSNAAFNHPAIAAARQQATEASASSNPENTNLPPLGKIEPFIFHRYKNRGHVITAERKIGSTRTIGTKARIGAEFKISTNGYEGALAKARQALTTFNEEHGLS